MHQLPCLAKNSMIYQIIENLQNSKINMKKGIEELEQTFDRQEQYSGRNCILIHGIPESPNENTDNLVVQTITEHLDIDIT